MKKLTLKYKLYILLAFALVGIGYFVFSHTDRVAINCSKLIPENPYAEGTGEYAGYDWSKLDRGSRSCEAYNQPFIDGCLEYIKQNSQYNNCLSDNN